MVAAADAIEAPPALKARLGKLGLTHKSDLVLHLPLRYEDETRVATIATAEGACPVQLEVTVEEVSVQFRPRRQLVARVADASGELTLRFLNFYGSQTRQLERARDEGLSLRVFGEIRHGGLGAEMVHPRYCLVKDDESLPESLTPVYPTTAGVSQTVLRKHIAAALAEADLGELLDAAWCRECGFPPFDATVRLLHAPPPGVPEGALQSRSHPAWRRIKFDELLAQQLSLRRAYLSRRRVCRKTTCSPAVIRRGDGSSSMNCWRSSSRCAGRTCPAAGAARRASPPLASCPVGCANRCPSP